MRLTLCGTRDMIAYHMTRATILFFATLGVCCGSRAEPPPTPSGRVAERLSNLAGLDNVGRVGPGLYRGNAPTEQGLDTLKAMGVRTVVNLRHYHGAREERGCRERGLNYVHFVVESSDAPSDEDVTRFLKIATDPNQQPVYFHCWRGKDRTGVFCAAYRMAVDGWTREEALGEMGAFGFFEGWRDLREYVVRFPERLERVWPRPAAS